MRAGVLVAGGWWLLLVLFGIYFVFAAVTASNVQSIHHLPQNTAVDLRSFDTAVIGAVLLAAILSVIYAVITGFVLLGRYCSSETDVGVWYGVSVASAFFMSFQVLQAGLIGHAYVDKARAMQGTPAWTIVDTQVLHGANITAYILTTLLFVYGWVLLFCKKAFGPHATPHAHTPLHDERLRRPEVHLEPA